MSELPTIQQVKQDLAKESGYASWQGYKDCWRGVIVDQAIEAISIEYCRRVLDYVAEHAQWEKEAILNVKNQLQ